MEYNHVVRLYSDGTEQHIIHSCKYNTLKSNDDFLIIHDGSKVELKESENQIRAKKRVFDYCRNNTFKWFLTLTLDPKKVNSFDYGSCVDALKRFRKYLSSHGIQYIFVPEKHESGAFHFHGLIDSDLPMVDSGHKIFNKTIFNIDSKIYNLGFTTCSLISDNKRVSTYVSKYISKQLVVPKGYKRYWVSHGLKLPRERILSDITPLSEVSDLLFKASFYKVINNEFGTHYLIEFSK